MLNPDLPRVFICSALRGDYEENVRRTQAYARFAIDLNWAPYAPHLYLPEIVNDSVETERNMGISCGLAFLKTCSELWAFTIDGQISEGMMAECKIAKENFIPIIYWRVKQDSLGFYWEQLDINQNLIPTRDQLLVAKMVNIGGLEPPASNTLQSIAVCLEDGMIYENFDSEIDALLDTGLTVRNKDVEECWEENRSKATD